MATCKHCGKDVQRMHGFADTGEVCFPCNQFIEIVRDAKKRNALAIIDGQVWVKGRPRWSHTRETFTVRFQDGRQIKAEFSPYREVPKHFRQYLPDNAEFVIPALKPIATKVRLLGAL